VRSLDARHRGALVANEAAVARDSRDLRLPPLSNEVTKMRIAPSLSVLCAVVLSACSMDSTSPKMPSISANAANLDRSSQSVGQVFTISNAAAGNSVLVFARGTDGSLRPAGTYATGGTGTGEGLNSQGALALDESRNTLVAVNAGSNEISAFTVGGNGSLTLTDKIASGGSTPISVTISHGLVYVVNAGGAGNIAGFRLAQGKLTAIANSSRPLSGSATAPAEISFDPSGGFLVVTEKNTQRLSTYVVDSNGLASGPTVTASSGVTPFGFGFTQGGTLIVSEAFGGAPDGSAVSSYSNNGNGTWNVISGSVPTTETSACWIVVTESGRFTYTTNAASGTITGYAVNGGALTRLAADGVTANLGASGAVDMALSRNSQFLYALSGGTHAIVGFTVSNDGSLTPIANGTAGVPSGVNGLVAR
jgi:6-phosphogluconolactonase